MQDTTTYALSLYADAARNRLMSDSVADGVLRELTLDAYFPDVQDWDANADLGESVYPCWIDPNKYPALFKRVGAENVVVTR